MLYSNSKLTSQTPFYDPVDLELAACKAITYTGQHQHQHQHTYAWSGIQTHHDCSVWTGEDIMPPDYVAGHTVNLTT